MVRFKNRCPGELEGPVLPLSGLGDGAGGLIVPWFGQLRKSLLTVGRQPAPLLLPTLPRTSIPRLPPPSLRRQPSPPPPSSANIELLG